MRPAAVAILAAVLPLAACGSSTTSPSSAPPTTPTATNLPATGGPSVTITNPTPVTPTPSDVPACATDDLTVTAGRGSGAAGHIYTQLVFTNSGKAACTLFGYPGVSLATGSPPATIGPGAERDTNSGSPQLVTLAPGAAAETTVRYAQAGNFDCTRTPAQFLLIYPPNQTASTTVPFNADACTNPPIALLQVGFVKPSGQ
ncbi:DUF4232 domain-containing protein [Nocardia arthritidis]|uniref:DUF4232 domain-containing protein n=1 Tax=Nocardia arthritidis TaxID=228602 RepID=A0A6G9YRV2_9NOCA|nr:DUF4232 domain-containing protein [Nocardia arthritidis]QIS15954.1 DUF4232 domain-containing protein [Nocardia arthritidis]